MNLYYIVTQGGITCISLVLDIKNQLACLREPDAVVNGHLDHNKS